MRTFRSTRVLVLPALVLPLVLSTVALSGTAWAKGAKVVSCKQLSGTAGGSWSLQDCNQPGITGGNSTGTTPNFPTTAGSGTFVITWNPTGEAHRGGPAGTTTIRYTATQLTGHKNKCGTSSEWELVGPVTGNTVNPAVKGKLKMFACVGTSGALRQRKPVKL